MKLSPHWLREFVDLTVDELQLADDLTLAGVAVESVRRQNGQTIFEMEITTNRPDAMNHYGVARECSALYDIALKPIKPRLPQARPASKPFQIEIQDDKGCARYTARVIRNVKIAPSPARILDRLKIEDHNGVSNAVDASNYTLMEMGHPTHAFDLDKLAGGKIVVRRARKGETLKTLDGVDRKLHPEDLIIADAVKPVGLAGIMGGLDTAISSSTRNILVESAWFDPATVRKSARHHGMHTDASHIFERGADWGTTPLACDRVSELILETAGGELEGDQVDTVVRKIIRHSVFLSRKEIKRLLGQDIPESVVIRILRRLGFVPSPIDPEYLKKIQTLKPMRENGTEAVAEDETSWGVELPTWRLDIERDIDLIEEIARVYGYNKFADTLPSFSGGVVDLPHAAKEARLRSDLLALGYNEAISPTFIAPTDAAAFSGSMAVTLANPLSEEQAVMRSSLVPGMLGMMAWNLNRGATDIRLFEIATVFSLEGDRSEERKMICIGATGNAITAAVHCAARAYSFFDLKGDIETLLRAFESRNLSFDAAASEYYHPGRSARALVDGHTAAQFGLLHPEVAAARKLKQEIYVAEIHLDRLFTFLLRVPRYQQLSRFPAVDRDFSFLFGDSVTFEQIRSAITALGIAELQSFQPAEIFRGGSVAPGKYSVLLRTQFQSAERTLRDDEVSQWSTQIVRALQSLGGNIRT